MYNCATMLKALRHKGTQKNIFIGLTIAVILGFAVSMIVISHDDRKTSVALATIGKRKISVQEYLNNYRAVQHQAEWMYGDSFNELRNRIDFKGEAWDRILLLDHAKKENLRVGDSEVVQWVTSQPVFKHKDRFDDKYYEMYVTRALRTSPREFEEEIRQMLTIRKLNEKMKNPATPTEEKIKERYAKERGENSILYAVLPWENFKDQALVDDKEAQQLSQALDEPDAKEKLKALMIQKKATELALGHLKDLKEKMKTADFETVLKEDKLDVVPLEKYRSGVYPTGIYPSDNLEKAVSTLKEGDVSDAFEIPKGAMIVKLIKTLPLDEKKFAEEKEAFKKSITAKEDSDAMKALLEKLRKDLVMNLKVLKEIFPSDDEIKA